MTDKNNITAFRLAIVTSDHDELRARGMLSFYDDVLQTRLADIDEKDLQPTKTLLLNMVDAIQHFNRVHQENVQGLALVTFNKLESLAWKTYTQLIRKAYREGTSLRAQHLRVE